MQHSQRWHGRKAQCADVFQNTVCYPVRIWLRIGEFAVALIPERKVQIMSQLHVDERGTLSLQATDVYGNIVDAAMSEIVWSNSNEAAAVSTVSDDGKSLTLDPVTNAVGQETTVSVSASIAGTVFTAQASFTVVAGAVAGIAIIENFAPKNPPPPPAPEPAPSPPEPAPAPVGES